MSDINTHDLIIEFGKHKGERWTRLPVSYLKWLSNQASDHAPTAKAELERRGTFTPDLEVSGHAIDRASLTLRKTWHQTALSEDEGLHAWLCRVAQEALEQGERDDQDPDRRFYKGMKFVFDFGLCSPVLKTVMINGRTPGIEASPLPLS